MEFKEITTQEQLDLVIGERLKRERESLAKKYEGFDDMKAKATQYEKQIASYQKKNDELSTELEARDEVLSQVRGELSKFKMDALKAKIAHENGIPYELASRLNGTSEDEIREDAFNLSELVKFKEPAPLRSTEPATTNSEDVAYKELLNNLI